MTDIVLIGEIGLQKIAFRASAIEAVVNISAVVPIPFAPRQVLGLSAIRSQVVTVVDCGIAVGGAACGPTGRSVLTLIDGHRYALRIDAIDDVANHRILLGCSELPLVGRWRSFVIGRVDLQDCFALLVDPALLIASDPVAIAA
jgi:purine-binding chemotaxis protein CheW